MQYVIKQVRAEGSFYWTGREYVEDMDEAQFFNAAEHAHDELGQMDVTDKRNTVVLSVEAA